MRPNQSDYQITNPTHIQLPLADNAPLQVSDELHELHHQVGILLTLWERLSTVTPFPAFRYLLSSHFNLGPLRQEDASELLSSEIMGLYDKYLEVAPRFEACKSLFAAADTPKTIFLKYAAVASTAQPNETAQYRTIEATSSHELVLMLILALLEGIALASPKHKTSANLFSLSREEVKAQCKLGFRRLLKIRSQDLAGSSTFTAGLVIEFIRFDGETGKPVILEISGITAELAPLLPKLLDGAIRASASNPETQSNPPQTPPPPVSEGDLFSKPPGARCFERDQYFYKLTTNQGKTPEAIEAEWNAKSSEEKRQIAPNCTQTVKANGVSKAVSKFKQMLKQHEARFSSPSPASLQADTKKE